MAGVFCGEIRSEVQECVGYGCVLDVRCWFSWNFGVWMEVEFRTKSAKLRQDYFLNKFKKLCGPGIAVTPYRGTG